MAKLPSLKELIENPKKREELTAPQLHDLIQQVKAMLRGTGNAEIPDNPADFAEKLSRGRWVKAPHLHLLSDALRRATLGELPRIMVSMPPRHGKSELISFWFPLWFLSKYPERKVILTSYEADFAADWGARVRNAVAEHSQELNIELSGSTTARNNWKLTKGGGMMTAGAGGPITGKGAHCLIIDDPIKNSEEASSEIMRENLWNWFQTTAFTRIEPGGFVVIVGTRWHEDDLIGRLERLGRTEDGLQWHVLKYPALAESNDPLGREVDEPLWPDRFDNQALATIRKGLSPYNWSALYQQRPSPEEGGGIRRKWWKYYKYPPAEFDSVIQSWDLAFKDLKASDFTVGQVWGRKGAEFYLLAQIRDRLNAPEVIQAIRMLTARFPKATGKLIEDKANGPAVIAMLQKSVPGVIPIKVTHSKTTRLQGDGRSLAGVVPLIEAGNVYLPDPDTSPWVWDLVEECASFPNGTNDDQLDALVHALTYLQPQGWLEIAKLHKEALQGSPPGDPVEQLNRKFHAYTKKKLKEAEKRLRNQQSKYFSSSNHKPW